MSQISGLHTSLRKRRSLRSLGKASPIQGGGGPVGPYPAPSGYRWGYVTENSITVTENGEPVVELERIAA